MTSILKKKKKIGWGQGVEGYSVTLFIGAT